MRDCALQASGELDRKPGGRSEALFGAKESLRRSVYGRLDRQSVDGPYRTFDFANPDQHTPKRHETTVPQQALWWLNGPFGAARAQALATAASSGGASDTVVVDRLYRALFQRAATGREQRLALDYLKQERAVSSADDRLGPVGRLAQVLMMSNGFCHVD